MNYGIISDIHSNFTALQVVLEFLKGKNVDKIINCGDIVGYGPQPNECIKVLSQLNNVSSVIGNHDWAVAYNDKERFNNIALEAINWTQKQLTLDNYDYISSLEKTNKEDMFIFVHGSPRVPLSEYIFGEVQAAGSFKCMSKDICFIGHTHTPICFECTKKKKIKTLDVCKDFQVKLDMGKKYIINVGSVGQPRDGDPRASVCTFDTEKMLCTFYRLEYDIESTQGKILELGLPGFLSHRLERGV